MPTGHRPGFTQQVFSNDHVTLVHAISASGHFLPLMIIFSNNVPKDLVGNEIKGWKYSSTKSGFISSQLFIQWFTDIFLKNISPQRHGKRKHQKINYAHFNEHGYSESTSEKCAACHIEVQPDDERFEIVWYGCDVCHRWWHRHCLSTEFQTLADFSCIDETTKFLCPACPVEKLYVVCFVQGENVNDFI